VRRPLPHLPSVLAAQRPTSCCLRCRAVPRAARDRRRRRDPARAARGLGPQATERTRSSTRRLQADLLSRVDPAAGRSSRARRTRTDRDPALIERGPQRSIEEQVGGRCRSPRRSRHRLPEELLRGRLPRPVEANIDTIVLALAEGRSLETRTARHILVETAEEADEVFALLRTGADFAELAEERSQDPGSAANGGEPRAQQRGVFVPEFDEAVWSARSTCRPRAGRVAVRLPRHRGHRDRAAQRDGPDGQRASQPRVAERRDRRIISNAASSIRARVWSTRRSATWDSRLGQRPCPS
jgi:hypothetical protein